MAAEASDEELLSARIGELEARLEAVRAADAEARACALKPLEEEEAELRAEVTAAAARLERLQGKLQELRDHAHVSIAGPLAVVAFFGSVAGCHSVPAFGVTLVACAAAAAGGWWRGSRRP